MRFSPKTVGVAAAILTVAIWTSFIMIARATAHRKLTPLHGNLLTGLTRVTIDTLFGVQQQARRALIAPDLIAYDAHPIWAKT